MSERRQKIATYMGDPRGGKGTIIDHLAKTRENVATDETGADYRAITKAFEQLPVNQGGIEHGMPDAHVHRALAGASFSLLGELASSRNDIIDEHGKAALYEPAINDLVPVVAQLPPVRKAVKDAFRKRVEEVRDSEEFDILAIDGRNLEPFLAQIEGTDVFLRTFVTCLPVEAAMRECAREKLNPGTKEYELKFREAIESVIRRTERDANREVDAVKPDETALDYWEDPELLDLTIRTIAGESHGDDYDAAFRQAFVEKGSFHKTLRLGAGTLAVVRNQQIFFDTTHFRLHDDPKGSMLTAADTMLDEALATNFMLSYAQQASID